MALQWTVKCKGISLCYLCWYCKFGLQSIVTSIKNTTTTDKFKSQYFMAPKTNVSLAFCCCLDIFPQMALLEHSSTQQSIHCICHAMLGDIKDTYTGLYLQNQPLLTSPLLSLQHKYIIAFCWSLNSFESGNQTIACRYLWSSNECPLS